MKKGFLILAMGLVLPWVAMAQTFPALQITNLPGSVSISWAGVSNNYSLQATANLSPPAWQVQRLPALGTGTINESKAGAQQFFRLSPQIALFQFALFYNVNMEIGFGAVATINAPVFCNQNIWEGSAVTTFASTVSAAGSNTVQVVDPFAMNYSGSGPATFAMAGQPSSKVNPLALASLSNSIDPLVMHTLLELPPAAYSLGTRAAYSTNGMAFLANVADLIISNFISGTNSGSYRPAGTNMSVYFQDLSLLPLPYDFFLVTNRSTHAVFSTNYVFELLLTNIVYAGYSWVTNTAFYDWREGWNGGSGPAKRVEAVQIDVAKFSKWQTNTANNGGSSYDILKFARTGHHIDSVYVYTSVPLTGSQLPAVRLVNGAQLPNPGNSSAPAGFTVATPFPIYVLGDYNSQLNGKSALGISSTANTEPAALMGDAITVLSDNWNDGTTSKTPTPSSTTVNAAMLTGIVPSNPTVSGNYSGGVENFMRLLESWGASASLTWNGSLVVLFPSQYATNAWVPPLSYYNAPRRNWNFDSNFNNFAKLPPLTPIVQNYVSP